MRKIDKIGRIGLHCAWVISILLGIYNAGFCLFAVIVVAGIGIVGAELISKFIISITKNW